MARPKSKNPRPPGTAVRLLDIERRYLSAAVAKETEQLRESVAAGVTLSSFIRAGAFERAKQILGMSLKEFEARETKGKKEGR